MVDLPLPDAPTMAQLLPEGTLRARGRKAGDPAVTPLLQPALGAG
jgi:hypothetical protein